MKHFTFKHKRSWAEFWKSEKKSIDESPIVYISLVVSNIAVLAVPIFIGIDSSWLKTCDAALQGRTVWYSAIVAAAILLGYEKIASKCADTAAIYGLLGGDGCITNAFFGCMESVVLEKRNTLLKGLNNISTNQP
ncbi:MAG: hypothetical protein FJ220_03620, partial [Kiritimatiellaceae bacterium]|nr:hypothetical protein [Kiritimatiellaceae bacterium]